jgi:hypothetical protein
MARMEQFSWRKGESKDHSTGQARLRAVSANAICRTLLVCMDPVQRSHDRFHQSKKKAKPARGFAWKGN